MSDSHLDWANLKGGAFEKDMITGHRGDRRWYETISPINLKYPETVGEDFNPQLNFNSHVSSEYAKHRNTDDGIDKEQAEPFVFFEFMEVVPKNKAERFKDWRESQLKKYDASNSTTGNAMNFAKAASKRTLYDTALDPTKRTDYKADPMHGGGSSASLDDERSFLEASKKGMFDPVLREYTGSIALYMPNDIQINDQIVYNEDSRKLFGGLAGALNEDMDKSAAAGTLATSTGGMVAIGSGVSKAIEFATKRAGGSFLEKFGAGKIGALIGGAASTVVGSEYQRSTGKAQNLHEYMAYQSTGMRNFTFTFTFLPDRFEESEEVTKIIKQFRMAAHAKRNDSVTLTVPSHVVTSFHGAGDMIQLPPCVIESVNISYNPNNTSFFKDGNNPVEVGMSVTLKEIVPIYKDDIEGGL